jgi:hypothetical protein
MEAFYHIARARTVRVNQYHCMVIPVLNAILRASSSAIRLCKAEISLLKVMLVVNNYTAAIVINNRHELGKSASYIHGQLGIKIQMQIQCALVGQRPEVQHLID